jgi:hypothetical protein
MHPERSSGEWIIRFVRVQGMRSREDLFPAEPKIDAFLTDLAVHGHVAAATQHQALHALVCLNKRALTQALAARIKAIRASKRIHIPVVLTRDEVAAVLALMDGTAQLVAQRLYGRGRRIMEAVRRRVKDIADQMKPLPGRSGQGETDRFTTCPAALIPLLQNHLAGVKTLHQQDLVQGEGEVYLPHALARQYPATAKSMGLAVWLSRAESCRGSTCWHHPSPSCGPERHQQGDQGGGAPGRSDHTPQRPPLSSGFCHPPATPRYGYPHASATARAQRGGDPDDLHPCPAAGRPGRAESLGRSRPLICILSCRPNQD